MGRRKDVAGHIARNTITNLETGCIEWTGKPRNGYGGVCHEGALGGHRVAWTLANGPIPEDKWVLHTCDNRKCMNVEHLYLGDVRDNGRDAAVRGRVASRKLAEWQVWVILDLYSTGAWTKWDLAKVFAAKYGVTAQAVLYVIAGRNWGHIGNEVRAEAAAKLATQRALDPKRIRFLGQGEGLHRLEVELA